MMKRIGLAVLAIVLVLALPGCIVRRVDSGDVRTESRDVEGFNQVVFDGYGNLTVEQGDTYSLELSGTQSVLDQVTTKVSGDRLYIDFSTGPRIWLFNIGEQRLDIKLTVPELTELEVNGAGDVTMDSIKGDKLEYRLSGAGKLSARDIEVRDLTIKMSGAGAAEVGGKATVQDISISGAGSYDARDLESRDAVVEMSGAGQAIVWATGTLDITASGAGSVEYYGNPDVTSNVSGAGSIHDRGSR